MKRIIGGKVYDTATAEAVGNESYSTPGDFSYCDETLYRTKKGAYFLHGEGGPMSKYSRDLGNNSTGGGEGITAMDDQEALAWLSRVDPDKALELFPTSLVEA